MDFIALAVSIFLGILWLPIALQVVDRALPPARD